MKRWLRRIRGALGMGLTWAVAWAPVAVLIGMIVDPDGAMDEMWFLIGAYPGFISGVVFSIVLWIAEGRRRFEELSLFRFAAWGAVPGLLFGGFVLAAAAPIAGLPWWLLAAVVLGPLTLLGAGSAAGTLALARMYVPAGKGDESRVRPPAPEHADPGSQRRGH